MELISDYVVCKEGDTLSSNQAALLRVFDVKMAAFKMYSVGCWTAEGGIQSLLHPPAASGVTCAIAASRNCPWSEQLYVDCLACHFCGS